MKPPGTKRIALLNAAAAMAAVLAAVGGTMIDFGHVAPAPRAASRTALADVVYVDMPGGQGIMDATGTAVAIAKYQRIVSASTTADWILTELASPAQVLAFTERSASGAPWKHKFADKQTLAAISNLEALMAMKPDLVIAESLGDVRRIARLREHGLAVFDIGSMRGTATLYPAMRRLGALLGHPERGALLADRYRRSLAGIADSIPASKRRQALYVSIYGDKLYGGTRGTTYHDILTAAGLIDIAAAHYRDWPEYSSEQLVEMDPALLVTRTGMGAIICRQPGLETLRACRVPGSIVEIDPYILEDPGLGILESAEAVHAAVYGGPP